MTDDPEVWLDEEGNPVDPRIAELLKAGRAVLEESKTLLTSLDEIVSDGSGRPPLR